MFPTSGVSCYVQVTVPEEHLGTVLGDLSSLRRAQILEVLVRQEARLICAHIPLASLVVRWIVTCCVAGVYMSAVITHDHL